MDLPWLIGIPIWLIAGWASFAYFEWRGIRHPDRQHTLSKFLYFVGSKFPLSIFLGALIIGLFIGTISTHLWWHWCPPGSTSTG